VYAGLGAFGISRDGQQIRSETEWNRRLQLTPGSHRFTDAPPFSETSVRSVLTLNATDLDMKAVRKAGIDQTGFLAQFIGEGAPYQRFRVDPAYRKWQDQVRAAVRQWEQRRAANVQSVVAR
jgi:hypothetical protein